MLDSIKITRRQSEIRQSLAELAGKPEPTNEETRSMESLDREYRTNEVRYRATLVAEDIERREAGDELATRGGREWANLVGRFELRQAVLALDEGRVLTGATKEIVDELRGHGGFRGIPVPLDALEVRAGETVASGVPSPMATMPIMDRLFAPTVAAKMGAQIIAIPQGSQEWPIATSNVAAAWAATETGNVAGPTTFATSDRTLAPGHTYGVQLRVTRKAMLQAGGGLEQAIRRDLSNAITVGLDRAVLQGSGASGEPLGVIAGAATYGITDTDVSAASTWAVFRAAIVRFMAGNAATAPADVKILMRPEVWDAMDDALITGTAVSEMDRLLAAIPAANVIVSANALAAPTGSPAESTAVLTTSAGGVAPIFVGLWGSVDLIRDPYSDAHAGGLRLTGLLTADVTASRAEQVELLLGLQ